MCTSQRVQPLLSPLTLVPYDLYLQGDAQKGGTVLSQEGVIQKQ